MPPPTAQGERGADDRGTGTDRFERLGHRLHDAALGHVEADLEHGIVEELPVLGDVDGLNRRADEFHAVLLEHVYVVQGHGQVERGLPADRGQDRVGLLAGDDAFDHVHGERLDVGAVGQLGSVMMVAGLLLTSTTFEPFVPQRLMACVPE
ncbi:MAG: hypothetical protein R2708_26360 [Vicinamibacterales bacterium]